MIDSDSAARQSKLAKDRNSRTVRITAVANGFLISFGDGRGEVSIDRADMVQRVNRFFDELDFEEVTTRNAGPSKDNIGKWQRPQRPLSR